MKSSIFNPLQLKHLMAHKGSCLRAIATPEGLRLCPDFTDKAVDISSTNGNLHYVVMPMNP